MTDELLQRIEEFERNDPANIWANCANAALFVGAKPPPIAWLYSERVQLGRGHLLTGAGGSSKTRALYQLAVGAIIGRVAWGWHVEATGRAVLVLTEDTAADVHRTLFHVCEGLELTSSEREIVASGIRIYPLAGDDVCLLALDDVRGLVKTGQFFALAETIKALGDVVFIGLDPALALTAGDELDQNHQRQLGKMADDLAVTTGASVFLVSHATKASLQTDELTSHNSRGGGAITDAVRGEYSMRTMTAREAKRAGVDDLEERKRLVQFVATKGNHLPPAAYVPVWLRRGEHGTLGTADVSFENTATDEPTGRDKQVFAVLQQMAATHTPTIGEWRDDCARAGLFGNAQGEALKKAMTRSCLRLQKAGLVERAFGRGRYQPTAENWDDKGTPPKH